MMGETAITGRFANASSTPATRRIGSMLTQGFEGQITTRSAFSMASSTPEAGAGSPPKRKPVTAGSQVEQWVETECELPAGQHDWQVWFVNEYQDPQTGAARWFWLHEFSIEGPLETTVGPDRDATLQLLVQTGRRLFRRPLSPDEQHHLSELIDTARALGQFFLGAIGHLMNPLLFGAWAQQKKVPWASTPCPTTLHPQ